MDQFEDVQARIFFECRSIIDTLNKIESKEDLLTKQDLLYKLAERVSVLKFLGNELDHFKNVSLEGVDNQSINSKVKSFNHDGFSDEIEEEVRFNNELNEIHDEREEVVSVEEAYNSGYPDTEIQLEPVNEETDDDIYVVKSEERAEEATEEIVAEEIAAEELIAESTWSKEAYERNVELLEKEVAEKPSADLRRINDFQPHHAPAPEEEQPAEQSPAQILEKKIKLANIKGLNKNIQSLFDSDPLENVAPAMPEQSLHKSNMPTDYMEAEKPKLDFKLDLNDRIAFTKELFGGSQTQLNEAMQRLNGFRTADEAKEYLSELYYDRNWKKADAYAQRLWSLVENKFL